MKNPITILYAAVMCFACVKNQPNFSGDLEIPDAIFTYSATGKGIPCIALTGGENLDKNLYPKEFLEHFNLIGANPDFIPDSVISTLTYEDILDDIDRVRKFLNLDKIAVMGHSMFSPLPLDYALKYPDNVLFTISTGSAPAFNEKYNQALNDYWETFATQERKEIFQSRMDSLLATDFNSLEPGEQLIKQYVAAAPKYFYNPRFDCTAVWDKVSVNIKFVNHYFGKLIASRDNSEAFKSLKVPALIMSGKYDFACPHILWDGIVEEIPTANYVLFENTGHNPMLEIPDKFTKTVLDWVESLK